MLKQTQKWYLLTPIGPKAKALETYHRRRALASGDDQPTAQHPFLTKLTRTYARPVLFLLGMQKHSRATSP